MTSGPLRSRPNESTNETNQQENERCRDCAGDDDR